MGLLVAAQALGGASPPILISLGGLVGKTLSDNPALATLPVSLYNLGLALSTIPAALLMRRHGRRCAYYLLAATLGVLSGLIAAMGIMQGSFETFCAGIARNPKFVVAVKAGVVTYGLMSFIMTATPIAMVDCGYSVGEATLGIQWHVLAMFAPSFFTAQLIARFGKSAITALGLILIAGSGLLALSGSGLFHFWGTLVLLGVGWNFGFIGATALVTDCYTPSERTKVQALNDFMVFGSVAIASFSSGRLLHGAGWQALKIYGFCRW